MIIMYAPAQYYSLGQSSSSQLHWTAPGHPSSNAFISAARNAIDALEKDNYDLGKSHIRKAIGIRLAAFKEPVHRVEADRILLRVINPLLSIYGEKLDYNALDNVYSFKKITTFQGVGNLPTIAFGIIITGSLIGGLVLAVRKVLKKKK